MVSNQSLDIALQCLVYVCKLAYLHIHEYLLILILGKTIHKNREI